jgi:hypothetical protein
MTEPITFSLSDIDQPPQSQQQAAPARSMSQPMTFHVSDIDAPTQQRHPSQINNADNSGVYGNQSGQTQDYLTKTEDFIHGAAQGAASEAWGFVKGIPASFGGLGKTGYDLVSDEIKKLPPAYRAYEQARAQGKGVMDAMSAANNEIGRQREAHDLLTQRVKELKEHPDTATGRAIVDLLSIITPMALGEGVKPVSETVAPEAATGSSILSKVSDFIKNEPKVSHVFDPETQKVVSVADIAAERAGTRPATGAAIQQAAKDTLGATGEQVNAAKEAARAVPISGVPSANFVTTLKGISEEASKPNLKSIPSDEMKNVKAVTDEILNKPSLTHDEFESYSKQLGDKIDDLKTTKTDKSARRLYTQAKQALQNEYYDQLATADPKISEGLQQVNREYANLNKRFNEGPAKTLFHAAAPEQIVKRIVSGSVTESQADAILKTAEDYDTANPSSPLGSIKDYLRKGTLYNQMVKFGQRTENGLITRLDPVAMISDLDKNPVYREIYGDAYEGIRQSLIDEANKQAQYAKSVDRRQSWYGTKNVVKGAGKTAAWGSMLLGGLQMAGVPIVQTLWSLLSPTPNQQPSQQ